MQKYYLLVLILSSTVALAMEQAPAGCYHTLFQKYQQKIKDKEQKRRQEGRYSPYNLHKIEQEYQQELAQHFPDCKEEKAYTKEVVTQLVNNLKGTLGFGRRIGREEGIFVPMHDTSYQAALNAQKAFYELAMSNYGRLFGPGYIYNQQLKYLSFLDQDTERTQPFVITSEWIPSIIKDNLNPLMTSKNKNHDFIAHYNKLLLVAAYTKQLLTVYAQPGMTTLPPYNQKECTHYLKEISTNPELPSELVKVCKVSAGTSTHTDSSIPVLRYYDNHTV